MAKISEETINNLREFMSRGCDYSGTQEVVDGLLYETLKELGTEYPHGNGVCLFDGVKYFGDIKEFVNLFWDKAVECILNVVATEE